MIILRLLLLLTNLHLKLLSTQGTGADKLLSTQRVKSQLLSELHTRMKLPNINTLIILISVVSAWISPKHATCDI